MGSSRNSASEIREVQRGYTRVDGARVGADGVSTARPKWLWGWVLLYFLLTVLFWILIGVYITNSNGVQWKNVFAPERMFNFHPLFQTLGFLTIIGHSIFLYRYFPDANIKILQWSHSLLNMLGFILMIIGVYAAGWSKDARALGDQRVAHHFVSVHSWVGLVVLTLIASQWLGGFFGLLWPGVHGVRRVAYRGIHIFTGNVIFLLGCATVLIGIDQLKPTSTMNTMALTVAAYALLGGYLLSTDVFYRGRMFRHPDARGQIESESAPLASASVRYT